MGQHFLLILSGLPLSLALTFSSIVIGFLLALCLTSLLFLTQRRSVKYAIQAYLILFTGTPLLVQIFLIYYGPGQFNIIQQSGLWALLSQAWFCAVLALALNSAAYTTVLFWGAMRALPKGQIESCYALGLTHRHTLSILLGLALRKALPSYGNELILVFKSTSLVYTITLMDVMGYTQYLKGQTYDSLTYYCMAGAIYLGVNAIMTVILRLIERRVLSFQS